jgi:hypothetical protein
MGIHGLALTTFSVATTTNLDPYDEEADVLYLNLKIPVSSAWSVTTPVFSPAGCGGFAGDLLTLLSGEL